VDARFDFMQIQSISRKVLRIHTIALGVAILLVNGVLIGLMWRSSRADHLVRLGVEAKVVGRNCAAALAFGDIRVASDNLTALREVSGVGHAAVYDADGGLFVSFGQAQRPLSPTELAAGVVDSIDGGWSRVVRSVGLGDEHVGYVVVEASTGPINDVTMRYMAIILMLSTVGVGLGMLLMHRLARAITRPVMNLAQVIQRIAKTGDYTQRAARETDDEIGVLADGFNTMIGTVYARDRQIEQHQHHLERLVSERTAELARSNERLQTELAERQRAQQGLLAAAEQWRATFDAISDGLCILGQDSDVLRCNTALARRFSLAPRDIVNHRIADFDPPLGELIARMLTAMADHSRRVVETHELAGQWLAFNLEPLAAADGKVSGAVLVLADVTEQRRLQDRLSQSQKMEAIGRLAGGVAHDFNNLLAVIQTCTTMVDDDLPADGPHKEDVREIKEATARAVALVRQLLAFGRKQAVKRQVLDVGDVIANSSRLLGRLLGETLKLETRLQGHVGSVRMDPTQLDQVLMNLAVNARDAMSGGGRLVIAARNAQAPADMPTSMTQTLPPGNYVEISVSDTGVGMTPAVLEHIFEPFFTTKATGRGTGLGLAIVYGIVQESGGGIHVESREGTGTTFRVFLPRVGQA
jgi:PAS domain S-box-containing protein